MVITTLFSGALWAFHPIRFSPLDLYVVRPVAGGPKSLKIVDKDGKTSKTANLKYSSDGNLTKEIYFDIKGSKEGESQMTYSKGLLIKEELISKTGKVLIRRDFEYTNKNLVKMKVYNAEGKSQMEQIYRYNRNLLTSGQENNGVGMLTFEISYTNSLATAIKIRNDDKVVISMVYIKYNPKGQVIERVRTQGGQKHRFKYYYKNEKIDHYDLSVYNKKQWVKLKTTRFFY